MPESEEIAPAISYDFAIVDEIDSVLIDEAALPLVLSERTADSGDGSAVRLARGAVALAAGVGGACRNPADGGGRGASRARMALCPAVGRRAGAVPACVPDADRRIPAALRRQAIAAQAGNARRQAAAAALVSSLAGSSLPADAVYFGEVSLSARRSEQVSSI